MFAESACLWMTENFVGFSELIDQVKMKLELLLHLQNYVQILKKRWK
jgi:hypothetical protein